MRRNRLRERLAAGEPTLGTHVLSTWPTLLELIGQTGHYDYVEFTAEYAPFDMHDLDNMGRALELADVGGMIKIEQSQPLHQAMRAIGSGFQSVLFADVRTVEAAAACVRAVRAETPRSGGLHGVGMRRDVGTMRDAGSPAFVKALDDVVIAIMVEKRECVEDLDAILSTKGLDMVQFGPADYAMSIGVSRSMDAPRRPEGRAHDDRDRAEERPPSARRDQRAGGGRALPRDGRETLLHRVGRGHPSPLVERERQGDAGHPCGRAVPDAGPGRHQTEGAPRVRERRHYR